MVPFLIEVPDVDVIMKLLQLFSLFNIAITGIAKGECRQSSFF